MADIEVKKRSERYRGRITQIPIYIGKCFRMFVYQSDWKVIPLASFIAMIVAVVVRKSFYVTMEGTTKGALALMSVALWNGFFNSIQVVCRERSIIKREHRSGMHISSYIFAHMVYQLFICVIQTVTTLLVFMYMDVKFPSDGVVSDYFLLDMFVTLLLVTYSADMLSLFLSSIVKSTTAAMTIMPLVLMVQLIFSGCMFSLPKGIKPLSNFMISNHATACICAEANYNSLPSSSGWNMLKKMSQRDDADPKIKSMVAEMELTGQDEIIKIETAKSNFDKDYESTYINVKYHWRFMFAMSFIFAGLSVVALEFIDKDKR